MKDRIKKALLSIDDKKNLEKIDSSYITTFDSYALSIVKKYHYLLNINKSISIVDSNIIRIKEREIIDEIFENLYKNKNEKFLKLINDFCTKDDSEIKNAILNINNKLNLKIDKKKYLKSYISTKYSEENINKDINDFLSIIFKKITFISDDLNKISYMDYNKFYLDLENVLNPIINSKDYDNLVSTLNVRLPNAPKNSDEQLKKIKQNTHLPSI